MDIRNGDISIPLSRKSFETLNTAVEKVCDLYSTAYNEKIQYIKDLCAGAVLLASAAALISALVILFRHLGGLL
jgi:diacylglycerol kinase